MNIQGVIKFIFFIFLIFFARVSNASEGVAIHENNGVVFVKLDFNEGGKTYWRYSGPASIPTKIELSNIINVKNYHIKWPWPIFEQASVGVNAVYRHPVNIPIYIIPETASQNASFIIKVTYLECSDFGCFPREYSRKYVMDHFAIMEPEIKAPETKQYIKGNDLIIEYPKEESNNNAEFILAGQNNTIYLPRFIEDSESFYKLFFKVNDLKDKMDFLLYNSANYAPTEVVWRDLSVDSGNETILSYILMAILGGFILNFMPCVLPVLSIKLYSFANLKSDSERKTTAFISLVTIIIYFMTLAGLTVFLKQVGKVFIPGFTLQEPFVIILCIIVTTIMLSILREKVSLTIPQFFQSHQSTNLYLSTIISTLVSTLLATPCTAPFLATSMTFALTQSEIAIFIIMISAGFGFGLPYFITIFIPSFLNILPKSGPWQAKLKKFFSLLLVGTIIWLVWLINSQLGMYSAFAMLFLVYLLRFAIEYEFSKKSKILFFALLILLSFIVPFSVGNNFQKLDNYYKANWQNYNNTYISSLIEANELVLISVTADWCVTCQVNKFLVLERIKTINLMKKYNVHGFIADLTREDKAISEFLKTNDVSGIPFTIIYGIKNKKGIVLPVLFDYKELEGAILSLL